MTDNLEELERQIDRLANFIMHKIEGEPSQSQGAVDTAIRIMGDQAREVEGLRAEVARLRAAAGNNVGPDDPAHCPGQHGESCCGWHDKCRAALEGRAERKDDE